MAGADVQTILERIYAAETPSREDIEAILRITDPAELALVLDFADTVRRANVGLRRRAPLQILETPT